MRGANHDGGRERGSVLVMAVFVLVLVTAMGVALLFLTQNELRLSDANLRVKQAFYMAEAGIEDGRRALFDANGSGSLDDDLFAAGGGVDPDDIEISPAALGVTFAADGTPTAVTGTGDDLPLRALTALGTGTVAAGWYAAYLSNDPVDGTATTDDLNQRVMLTAIGIGSDRSTEVVQAIVEPHRPLPPLPGSTITLVGADIAFASGNSNPSVYSGNDCGATDGLTTPIVGVIGDGAEQEAEDGVATPNGPDFASGGLDWDETVSDLTDPTDPGVAGSGLGTVDPVWTDCLELVDMIEDLRSGAVHLCQGTAPCSIPNGTNLSDVVFIDRDFSLGASDSGQGILVVTGSLNVLGQASWEGILLVVGEGVLIRNGSGNGYLSGTVFVADVAGPDDVYGTADDCTDPDDPDGFGESTYQVNGGGNGDITYCSTHIDGANAVSTYRVVEFVQH